jgi:hypothetical protein
MRGQGAAIQMTEIEKLRLRVAELEKSRPPVTAPAATRLVPLGAGFRDAQGRPIMVPASGGESLGDRLVRKQFADIGRDAFERDEAIRAIGQEVVADKALYSPPEPSPSIRPTKAMFDTRTGLDSGGPQHDSRAYEQIDKIAEYHEKLDRAEAMKRHKDAFGEK